MTKGVESEEKGINAENVGSQKLGIILYQEVLNLIIYFSDIVSLNLRILIKYLRCFLFCFLFYFILCIYKRLKEVWNTQINIFFPDTPSSIPFITIYY